MTKTLALFDLDHTLLPIDSDYEWGQFLVRIGAVDKDRFEKRNAEFLPNIRPERLTPPNISPSLWEHWRNFQESA